MDKKNIHSLDVTPKIIIFSQELADILTKDDLKTFKKFLLKHEDKIQIVKKVENNGDCIDFVFKNNNKYISKKHNSLLLNEIEKTIPVLKELGYVVVEQPEINDIVVFYFKNKILHYGKLLENNWVEQKLGKYAIVKIKLEYTPTIYGSNYFFIHKK